MSASGDERPVRLLGEWRPGGLRAVSGVVYLQPLRDFLAWKQQLAGHAPEGQRFLGDEVIDLPLLHPQKRGKLASGVKFRHGAFRVDLSDLRRK
jgi:hypothetical protein